MAVDSTSFGEYLSNQWYTDGGSMLDDIDIALLALLQSDARVSNAEIARRIGMAPSATLERVRKLEEKGVVTGYAARIRPEAVGLGLLAFIFVRSEEGIGSTETERALAAFPEVLEVHHVAGEDCFLLKVRVADTASLGALLRDRLGAIPAVRSTRTTIVLQTVKEGSALPLPAIGASGVAASNGHVASGVGTERGDDSRA
jgi:Lrp/AsnC family leucine-responsive transcriptional regulator